MATWKNIIGQQAVIGQLRQAYTADRLPHGLIFSGPVGVGKATTAAVLAMLFLCERPVGDTTCGKCPSCLAFAGGAHADFHIVTKELIRYHDKTGTSKGIDLSINVIRPEVVEKAARKPTMNRGKVFVIEQAELMSTAAQNALLKTLEEPAGRTLIVLITSQVESMLSTIRSRCRVVTFAALSDATVIAQLQARGIPAAMAQRAARLAGGSLGVALKWIEDGVIEPAEQLVRQIDSALAGGPANDLPEWFKSAAEAYAEKQLARDELSSKPQATREGLLLYLQLLTDHVRGLLRATDDAEEIDRACGIIDAAATAEQNLDANVNVALLLQQLAINIEQRH